MTDTQDHANQGNRAESQGKHSPARQRPIRIWADTSVELNHFAEQRGLSVSRLANVVLAEWVAREKAKARPHLGNTSAFENTPEE